MTNLRRSWVLSLVFTLASAGAAHAQDAMRVPSLGLLEVQGGYGVQFGSTPYLPAGTVGDYQHPIVNGPSVGGTAGVYVIPGVLAVIGTYEYTQAWSVDGSIAGILDRARGQIEYHTAVLGIRMRQPLGPGALRIEAGAGVIFPYQTRIDLDYGAALGQLPTPITGTGSRIDNYSVGFGGAAAVGYELPLWENLYLALNARVRLFEAENSGETTGFNNYVTDFTAVPPTATSGVVAYGDGHANPSTNSVQDARLQLALGASF